MKDRQIDPNVADVIDAIKGLTKHVDMRFDVVEKRLEHIEFLATGQEERISILEDKVRQLATHTGLTFSK